MNPLTQFKRILILPILIALTLVALVSPQLVRADAVTDWNLIASNAIVVTAGQPPPVSVLHFAMVQGAVYDAVNAIERSHRPDRVRVKAARRGRERDETDQTARKEFNRARAEVPAFGVIDVVSLHAEDAVGNGPCTSRNAWRKADNGSR